MKDYGGGIKGKTMVCRRESGIKSLKANAISPSPLIRSGAGSSLSPHGGRGSHTKGIAHLTFLSSWLPQGNDSSRFLILTFLAS